MRRLLVTALSALVLTLIVNDAAEAQRYRGGFGGAGFRGGGFHGGGFRAVGIGGARWAGGYARPGWGVAGGRWGAVGRAGWVGGRPVWGGARWAGYRHGWGYRPGWGYRWPLYGAGLGLATAAYYGSTYYAPYGYYGYGYGPDECAPVRQSVWDGYGYRVVWVNPCNY
jgi:hypothetical protein